MNELVELKGNDKLKMQNDKNYAYFLEGKWICEISIHESFYLWPSSLSKFVANIILACKFLSTFVFI